MKTSTKIALGVTDIIFNRECGWSKKLEEYIQKEIEDDTKKRIGLLRQYLNERTSKDLITNEELERFLLK